MGRARPVRPGDILVLVRRRTAFIQRLVRALKEKGVPVGGVDRLKLVEQIAGGEGFADVFLVEHSAAGV